jgi:hypothetical protein
MTIEPHSSLEDHLESSFLAMPVPPLDLQTIRMHRGEYPAISRAGFGRPASFRLAGALAATALCAGIAFATTQDVGRDVAGAFANAFKHAIAARPAISTHDSRDAETQRLIPGHILSGYHLEYSLFFGSRHGRPLVTATYVNAAGDRIIAIELSPAPQHLHLKVVREPHLTIVSDPRIPIALYAAVVRGYASKPPHFDAHAFASL